MKGCHSRFTILHMRCFNLNVRVLYQGNRSLKRREFTSKSAAALSTLAAPNLLFSPALAALPGTVTWGGAYLLEDKPGIMPYTRSALQMSKNNSPNGTSVNKTLLREIRDTDWTGTGLDLRTGLKKKETRYGMVFGLAAEQVLAAVYLPAADKTQYILRQIGYVTVYDIVDRRIVSCIAVRGRYIESRVGKFDEAILPKLFFNLLADKNNTGSVARFMVEKIKDYPFAEKYQGEYFQVNKVVFVEYAIASAAETGINTDSYGDDTALAVTTAFSEKLQSPIVPYRKTTAINRDMLSEMKIVSTSGDSALNTALPLRPADCGIEITHQGWDFVITASSSTRNQVTLVTRLTLRCFDKDRGATFFNQEYYGKQDFLESTNSDMSIARENRLFMLHETIIDRAFAGIKSEKSRGIVFDGEEITARGQKTFIQAAAEDWDMFSAESNLVLERLPRVFGG